MWLLIVLFVMAVPVSSSAQNVGDLSPNPYNNLTIGNPFSPGGPLNPNIPRSPGVGRTTPTTPVYVVQCIAHKSFPTIRGRRSIADEQSTESEFHQSSESEPDEYRPRPVWHYASARSSAGEPIKT